MGNGIGEKIMFMLLAAVTLTIFWNFFSGVSAPAKKTKLSTIITAYEKPPVFVAIDKVYIKPIIKPLQKESAQESSKQTPAPVQQNQNPVFIRHGKTAIASLKD